MINMKIHQLFLHPVKSFAAQSVNSLTYDSMGPIYDRNWMVVNSEGKALTQRVLPKMCLVKCAIDEGKLTLNAESMPEISVKDPNSFKEVNVWSDTVKAGDCGDEVADWLSHYLGKSARLVRVTEQTYRQIDQNFAGPNELVGFADGFPTLIVTQASLDEFNSHMETQTKTRVDMRRFRPNIVISGCEPFAEDSWSAVRIGELEFNLVKPCSRCIMPSINPDNGEKEMQVNQVLLATRRRNRETYFGQNATHKGEGTISIGDSVELIS